MTELKACHDETELRLQLASEIYSLRAGVPAGLVLDDGTVKQLLDDSFKLADAFVARLAEEAEALKAKREAEKDAAKESKHHAKEAAAEATAATTTAHGHGHVAVKGR